MVSTDFTLTQGDVLEVKGQSDRIRLLFPQVSIKFEHTEYVSKTKNLWVTIEGATEDICYKCQQYITALTNPETKVIVKVPEEVQKQLLLSNGKKIREIELQNSVVFDLNVLTHNVSVQGEELQVVLAKSIIDDLIEKCNPSNGKTTFQEMDEVTQNMSQISIGKNVKNFGLKLGFTENDISQAASNCFENGIKVNEDAILKELMKQQPQKAIACENSANELFQEEFVAKTVAEHTSDHLSSDNGDLRGIVIDGSNVAMCHGHKQVFSCTGIEIVVNWFKQRGHRNIVVFVPQWRQESPKGDCPIINQEILTKLEKEKILVFTPSRRINGRRVICYDDRYIVKYAVEADSIIVSNDNFRDLQKENSKWKQYIDQHILMYSFVNDMFMPPDDPLGRSGPNLDEFLKTGPYKAKICPYKNKCTYGTKCRYFHPETTADTSNNNMDRSFNYLNSKQNSYNFVDNVSHHQSPGVYMTCAAEINMLERQSAQSYHSYDNDIVAKCPSVVHSTNDQQHREDLGQNLHKPKVYQPMPNYYQHPQQPSQQPLQHRQMQAQHFYNQQHPQSTQRWSGGSSQQPQHYNNNNNSNYQSYTLQQQQQQQQQQNYYPVHQQNLNTYPTQHTPHSGMMNNRYVHDSRQINGHLYQGTTPITHHNIRPIETRDAHSLVERPSYRTEMETSSVYQHLLELFPNRRVVCKVLLDHPNERDISRLVTYVLNESSH